ncbi:MAG: OBAP family protein [Pseudohongiella sp.]|nr:OBAP family protein [Pseudohongiella sp.]MDO9521182.1 OBAP family protein [Pseudohongiella sp.]MDP2127362.1 OBAP family protein [Pseudohongiella sp.]
MSIIYSRAIVVSALLSSLIVGCNRETSPGVAPPGADTSVTTDVLEAGARILQDASPLDPFDIHLVGFHPMKSDPYHQLEAHHFCHQVNEDFAQCVLFDGDTNRSNLNGIEYIISESLFNTLPEEERIFWHPHNYEILSGQLVAPGIPEIAEIELMAGKMNSYGKTWHVWRTSPADSPGDPSDPLPLGEPMLGWSFNRDGEAMPGLVERRDARMQIDSADKRERRQELLPRARPQSGVDALQDAFPADTQSIPGVSEMPTAAQAAHRAVDSTRP